MQKNVLFTKLISLMLIITFLTLLNTNAVAGADSITPPGNVDGSIVYGRSTISRGMASGYTYAPYYDPYVYCGVCGNYTAYSTDLGLYHYDSDCNQALSSAVVSFSAPSGYKSVSITCTHYAEKNGIPWFEYTEDFYS